MLRQFASVCAVGAVLAIGAMGCKNNENNDNDRDRYCEGLRLAGVPEG